MLELLNLHIIEILAGTNITGVIVWFFDRKKRKNEYAQLATELNSKKIENDKSVVDIYKEALDDLKQHYDEKFDDLRNEIELLKKNLNLWKDKYRSLKKQFEDYRKKHELN